MMPGTTQTENGRTMLDSVSEVSLTADEKAPLLIPAWYHDELERRQADFDENPHDARPWAELNCRLVAESVGSGGRQLSARSERPDHREHENQPGR